MENRSTRRSVSSFHEKGGGQHFATEPSSLFRTNPRNALTPLQRLHVFIEGRMRLKIRLHFLVKYYTKGKKVSLLTRVKNLDKNARDKFILYFFEFRMMEMFYFLFDSKVRINILLLNVIC